MTWKLASWIINFQFALMMLRLNKVTPPVTKGSPTHPHPHRSPCEAGCWLYSSSRSISHRHGVAVACNWYREWRLEMMEGKPQQSVSLETLVTTIFHYHWCSIYFYDHIHQELNPIAISYFPTQFGEACGDQKDDTEQHFRLTGAWTIK